MQRLHAMFPLTMKKIKRVRLSSIIIFSILLCVLFFTKCMNNDYGNKTGDHFKGDGGIEDFQRFAGSVTCGNCHKDIFEKQIHSAHYLTSQPATEKFIKGSFEAAKNKFVFDSNDVVMMVKRKDSFYQAEYYDGIEKITERFDMVIGSGTRGQGYLYWRNNQLFQLPISYFTVADQWANSPGFSERANFSRPIEARCLECHSTYFNTISYTIRGIEEYDRKTLIYGVTCEKCHGPGAKHMEYQIENPKETIGKYIINPAAFSRQQKLDMCSLCHGGSLQKTKPSFSFMPGDSISNFFIENKSPPNPNNIDVHGNQYGLLRSSKCFRMSATLTCITCHNIHENERGQAVVFSQRCISCHNDAHERKCKLTQSLGEVINTNCIDCHMPVKASEIIDVKLPGSHINTAALVRSHFISIYPDETKRVIAAMKKLQ